MYFSSTPKTYEPEESDLENVYDLKIHDLFKFSSRGQRSLFIITPPPNDSYVYRMSVMWNSVRTVLSSPYTSFPIYSIKTKLKVYLLNKQKLGDNENWIENNFA